MIKLKRGPKPNQLTSVIVGKMVDSFKASNKRVWDKAYIKEALLASSHGKCAYCECYVTVESKYMEVEHFNAKSQYPDDVINWLNLLPSCKRCNGNKGNHDVKSFPIINPYSVDPKSHLCLKVARFKGKTSRGIETISVIKLNEIERVLSVRHEIINKINERLADALSFLGTFLETECEHSKKRLIICIAGLLKGSQPEAAYAATQATALHRSDQYKIIVSELKGQGLWGEQLNKLHEASLVICFESAS